MDFIDANWARKIYKTAKLENVKFRPTPKTITVPSFHVDSHSENLFPCEERKIHGTLLERFAIIDEWVVSDQDLCAIQAQMVPLQKLTNEAA